MYKYKYHYLVLSMVTVYGLFWLHHSIDNIIHFIWDHYAHCGIFDKNGVLLMFMLEGVSIVANFISLINSLNKTETSIY